jgi:hypothetical protein
MDCAACGKPISVTAKFCGKCGAPVKRPAKAPETETAAPAVSGEALAQEHEHAHAHEDHSHDHDHAHQNQEEHEHDHQTVALAEAQAAEIEDLVVTLSPPATPLQSSPLMDLDLNLSPLVPPHAEPVLVAPAIPPQPEPVADTAHSQETLLRLEQHQQELKSTLEKHSLLLDFISLASQQQTHLQSQPHPNEDLLHKLVEQQTQFAVQLAQLQNHLTQAAPAAGARLPEEFKLLLEKQKIELQKSFSQGIAQTTENAAAAQEVLLAKVDEKLAASTTATQSIEKQLAPVVQSVTELKTKWAEVAKKVDSLPATASKSKTTGDSADKQDSAAMIFIIGLLCGLTVVLSSLAIYNFLSHDPAGHAASAEHDAPAAESAEHDDKSHNPPHDKSHDKPAADSHGKEKAH